MFKYLVLARIIEPTSKLDSLRALAEAGVDPPSCRTVKRRLRVYAGLPASGPVDSADAEPALKDTAGDGLDAQVAEPAVVDSSGGRWRSRLARACAPHVGLRPAMLRLYDVTTLHFETHEGDGFRESGFSKEHRLEPQSPSGCSPTRRASR